MVSALGKLAAQAGRALTPDAGALVEAAGRAESVELQQRALEVQALLRMPAATQRVALPYDAAAEDVGAEPGLPFLDAFVQQVGAGWAHVMESLHGDVSPAHHPTLRHLSSRLDASPCRLCKTAPRRT